MGGIVLLPFKMEIRLIIFSLLNSGSIWLEGWKSERIENCRRMEKLDDRKKFNFPPFFWLEVKKLRDEKSKFI